MKKKNVVERVYPVAVWYGACAEVAGFDVLYGLMKQRMSISGKSMSTLKNYSHHVAKMALHFGVVPTELDEAYVVEDLPKQGGGRWRKVKASFFFQ